MFEGSESLIPSIWASMNSWFTPTVLFVFLNLMIGTIAITSSLATQKGNDQQNQDDPRPQQLVRSPSMLQRLKSINFYTQRWQQPTTNFAQAPGTDAHITSHHLTHQHEPQEYQPQSPPTQWTGGSPTVLERLKSFNLYNYLSQEPSTNKTLEATDTHYTPQRAHEQEEHKQGPEEEEEEEEKREEEEIQEEKQSLDEVYSELKGGHVNRTKSDTKPTAGEMPKKLPKKMKKSASTKSAFSHFGREDIVESRRPATVKEGKAKVTQEADDDEVDARADVFINEFRQQLKLQRIDSIIRYKDMINRGSGK